MRGPRPGDLGGIRIGDLGEVDLAQLSEAERDGLLAEVRELAAGDLVAVDASGRSRQAGFERLVDVAHGLPVRLEIAHGLERQAGVALGVRERGDQAALKDFIDRMAGTLFAVVLANIAAVFLIRLIGKNLD